MTDSPTPPLVQTFMTHRMSDEAILMLATGREKETERVMDAVQRSLAAAPGALQHVLIYGPRGFGKSFVARLVQIETAQLAAAQGMPIPFVLLPEEQHNLTRNPHALPAYIAHRIADLRTGEDQSWSGAMFQWPDPAQEARQWAQAVEQLDGELDRFLPTGQGMAIVVIENFDYLLASVFKDEAAEQRLRQWLDRRSNRLMLIATATGSVDMDYERPLFQAFQSIRLEPWSPDTCIVYFNRYLNRGRKAEEAVPLDAAAEAKARAVADFIGGNPRLAQLLADVLETQDALSVAGTMNALADKLADYYRRRIDDLPSLAQGLLDALVRGGEPASQTELAHRVNAGGQSDIARVMQGLQRADIIRGLPALDGRETLYRVTDRVFVHFYRLRQGHQLALKTPLATILDFLRAFYSRAEQKEQAMQHLSAGRPAEARIFADLAREGGAPSAGFNAYLLGFGSLLQRLARGCDEALPVPIEQILHDLDERPEDIANRIDRWKPETPIARAAGAIIAAQALTRLGLAAQADERLTQEIVANADSAAQFLLHFERGILLFNVARDRTSAIRCWATAGAAIPTELPESLRASALRSRAWALGALGRHEEALGTAREAADLAAQAGDVREQAEARRDAAFSLGELGRHEEAIGTAREAADLAAQAGDVREQAVAQRLAAFSLGALGRHEEAIGTAREAADLAAQAGDVREQAEARRHAAFSLGALGRHEEALSDALQSFALAQSVSDGQRTLYAAIVAIDAAAHVSSPEAIQVFASWVKRAEKSPQDDEKWPDWRLWLEELFAAATRARAWEVLDELLDDYSDRLPLFPSFGGSAVGAAIARAVAAEGRAAGFEAARGILPRVLRLSASPGADGVSGAALSGIIAAFARDCRDAGLIRDIAGLLTPELGAEAPKQASLLLTLAQVDEAKNPQALLARMDPDIALWVRRLRDLPEPSAAPRRRAERPAARRRP
ncbi:AAA family ATPase [Accumulibacter sp.]|uniref:AAA family ATPase n=1 Tax=Accumulibacter sp. TaxID=2053492 RepID=UPI002603DA89|nr:AAA family ATPase [Accumulibacter sp.]